LGQASIAVGRKLRHNTRMSSQSVAENRILPFESSSSSSDFCRRFEDEDDDENEEAMQALYVQTGAKRIRGWRKWRSLWLGWWVAAPVFAAVASWAGPVFDTSTPINFFTNVASRLLSAELKVNWGQIEIYPTNQYTPSVHHLLQVTANIWDAQNTNFYPTVFRPLFSKDASNNIFICGYQQVTGVIGISDPQLATPYDASQLTGASGSPIADANGPVNVYGVPWVIGAKQGLPNFNQLSLVTAAQVTRKLEVTRDSLTPQTATYGTNQMYIMGITNGIGLTFWNSYNNAYPRPVTVCAWETLSTTLTNFAQTWNQVAIFTTNVTINAWPGSKWSGVVPNAIPQAASFLPFNWSDTFLSPLPYNPATHQFDLNAPWQLASLPLDQFGLAITNYLQTFILDGTNVIDYVQICSPVSAGNLNQALLDPNYPSAANLYYQWSTNTSILFAPTPYGVINQIWVSGHPNSAPTVGNIGWSTAPTPMGSESPDAEAAYFNGFFTPTFQYGGQVYVNRDLEIQAPYTPSRTVYTSFLLQANDPLVHYLASDLNAQVGALSIWSGKQQFKNGYWSHSDDPSLQPLPVPPATPVSGRYQPWGKVGQMALMAAAMVDANAYNLAYKDPCVWGSDYWSFPTGQVWSVSWLGQVHRGTPWQTIYLKSTNILALANSYYGGMGLFTWANWTGNLQGEFTDGYGTSPLTDFETVSLLAAMLDTNDLRTLLSVNNPDPNAWASYLDGMTALTNTAPAAFPGMPFQFSPVVLSSNSAQAAIIASAILSTKANTNLFPSQTFPLIGTVLATPQLSIQSPFLNVSTTSQTEYGINDQAYEMIPSQLLSRLRLDSIGNMVLTNGVTQVQFSGYDGHQYAVQVSSDLLHWSGFSTNGPVNGVFGVAIPGGGALQFYRSVLIQ
jgi:hypothetical protein